MVPKCCLAAAIAVGVLMCAPIAAPAQKISALPIATTPTGAEKIPAAQGSGCATSSAPCTTVVLTAAQIAALATSVSQPLDADLTAIAALSTQAFGRSLLTGADAPTVRSLLGTSASGADTGYLWRSNNLSDLASASAARANLGLGTLATQSGTFSGSSSGVNTGDQTSVSGNAGTATTLQTGRTLSITGDLSWTSPTFTGAADVTAAATLTTVNSNVGTFGSAAAVPVLTVNAKGLVTAVSTAPIAQELTFTSGVSSSVTGTTAETTLATINIPASTMGPNGQVEVVLLGSSTNSAGSKTFRIKFGGVAYWLYSAATEVADQTYVRIANRGSTASQVGFANSIVVGLGKAGGSPLTTSTVDTTAVVPVTITGQLSASTDTMAVESYLVRVTYGS